MTRGEFLALLTSRLTAAGVATRPYEVQPGLADLGLQLPGDSWTRLRIVRTGQQ